jgi:hypothetical protein
VSFCGGAPCAIRRAIGPTIGGQLVLRLQHEALDALAFDEMPLQDLLGVFD